MPVMYEILCPLYNIKRMNEIRQCLNRVTTEKVSSKETTVVTVMLKKQFLLPVSSVSHFRTAVFTSDQETLGFKCQNMEYLATKLGQFLQSPIKQHKDRQGYALEVLCIKLNFFSRD